MEFKMRVWDKKGKKMLSWSYIKETGVYALSEGLNPEDFFVIPTSDRYVPLLYTGINDIKSTEIYAGDIVKGVGKRSGRSGVFFDVGVWQPFAFLSDYSGEDFEIIGNIFENPELERKTEE